MRSLYRSAPIALLAVIVFLAQLAPALAETQSSAAGCQGAAEWLAGSEQRILPVVLTDYDRLDELEAARAFRAGVLAGQEGQAQSNPPPAAEGLNSQILATFALLVAMTDRALASGDPEVFEEDLRTVTESVSRTRVMARKLKRECNLTESGEFFDAGCYGPDAAAWYQRASGRAADVVRLVKEAEEALLKPLSIEEETALTNRLATAIGVLEQEQAADAPPHEFRFLQDLYLDLFGLFSRVFSQAMTADEAMWGEFESDLASVTLEIPRERARLDIAC